MGLGEPCWRRAILTTAIPVIAKPDTAAADALLARIDQLTTFEEVADWDSRAEKEIAQLTTYLTAAPKFKRQLEEFATTMKSVHSALPFLRRILSKPKLIREAEAAIKELAGARTKVEDIIDQLENCRDRTPNSKDDQKMMLKELRLKKKELVQNRKEVRATMRSISTDARQRSAQVGAGFSGMLLTTGTSRRYERMAIRLDKEAKLAAHEDAKSAIERQIHVVERAILWIEKFR